MALTFRVVAQDGATAARVGELRTAHGALETPVFMPVGTQATVKTLTPADLRGAGAHVVLANTYHLYLRPGSNLVDRFGGLHAFMAWDRCLLTDSGGFQVFSLGHLRDVREEGVTFRSHLDGSTHVFTPESVVRVQEELGSDIAMVLDECIPYPVSEVEARESFERTSRWAERALAVHRRRDQVLFGIVQGGMYPHLRRESASQLIALDFPGYGIGGLSVGEPKDLFYEMMTISAAALPAAKPRYVMGVGAPEDIFEAVMNGIDMFDCVLQTRLGRNGGLFTRSGRINIRNARFRQDRGPVDPTCDCATCQTFSLAYLHHLFRTEELLAYRLASLHNIRWTIKLVEEMRNAIRQGTFASCRQDFLNGYTPPDASVRTSQRTQWSASRRRTREGRQERNRQMLDGVLLDIDGTLLLSNDAHAGAWSEAFQKFGYDIPANQVQPLIGMGGDMLMARLVPELDSKSDAGKQLTEARKHIFLTRYAPTLQPSPGARDLVQRLKRNGLQLAVATSSTSEELQTLLKAARIEDLIEVETTADDATEAKPAPDIIHAALEKSQLEPRSALLIGDTPYDIEAGGKAGVAVIAVRCGGHTDEELRGAVAIYDDPADILWQYEQTPLGRHATEKQHHS